MGEQIALHGRCLALKLVRSLPPPPRPHASASGWCSSVITPTSPASPATSGSDTPTNPSKAPPTQGTHELASYQDGYLLFQAWQAANSVCVWDGRLVQAVGAAVYVGVIVGGILLVGGRGEDLDTISHAWARALLVPPQGFTLLQLGEVSGCNMTVVPQGQFTPLGDALCWVIHRLRETKGVAEAEAVRESLSINFPSLVLPDTEVIHAALSTLIRQRKVYHSGITYGIVQPLDPYYQPLVQGTMDHPLTRDTSALSIADRVLEDGFCHVAIQTDLAELITGTTGPHDKVIEPSKGVIGSGKPPVDSQLSLRDPIGRRGNPRTASLRLSPTRAANLAIAMAAHNDYREQKLARISFYTADDDSDITVRGERGSMLSKILRVSPRNRLASFSAQFPPPAWTNPVPPATTTHLHCVATQTTTQKHQAEHWWMAIPGWSPRSSTLPRKLHRARSSTPPTSRNSATPPLLSNSFQYMRDLSNQVIPPHHLSSSSTTPAHYSEDHLGLHSSPSHRPPMNRSLSHQPSPHSSPSHRPLHSSPSHRSSYISAHTSPIHRPLNQSTCQHVLRRELEEQLPGLSPSRNPEGRSNLKNHKHRSPARNTSDSKLPVVPSPDNKLTYKDLESSPSRVRKDHSLKKGTQEGECIWREVKDLSSKQGVKEVHSRKSGDMRGRRGGKDQDQGYEGEGSHQEKKKHHCVNKGRHHKKSHMHPQQELDDVQCRSQETILIQNEEKQIWKAKEPKNEEDCLLTRGEAEGEEPPPSTVPHKKESKSKSSSKDAELSNDKQDRKPHTEVEPKDSGRYDRSTLQLDLPNSHMNNSRKVNASPQKPEGIKNNVLHHNNSLADISKGSSSDLTARNLGYTEVDKCHKKLCSQTLDQLNQHEIKDRVPARSSGETHSGKLDNIISTDNKDPDAKPQVDDTNKTNSSSSPDAENVSVKTYPSLSELNFNFSSIAAQRILCGASVNSLDTLVEVNLAAEKRVKGHHRKNSSPVTPVTNTDLGFV